MKKESVVIFVHGIGANKNEWWGSTKNILLNDTQIPKNIQIDFWGYRTEKITSIWNRIRNFFGKGTVLATFDDLGADLITYLRSEHKDKKNIILFGHSMGGLVISAAVKKSEHTDIKIKEIVLCGTPLAGSNLAGNFKWFFNLLHLDLLYYLISSQHTKYLAKKSEAITSLSNKLQEFVTLNKANSSKTLLTFMKIIEDEVVSTDQERFGPFLDEIMSKNIYYRTLRGGHNDSIVNLDFDNLNYKHLKTWLFESLDVVPEDEVSIKKGHETDELVKQCIDSLAFSYKYLKNLKFENFDYLCEELNKFNHVEVQNNKKLKESRIKALEYNTKRKEEIIKKKDAGEELTKIEKMELEWSKKNYFPLDNKQTKTITKDGTEIISIEEEVEVTNEGSCIFHFIREFKVPNEEINKTEEKDLEKWKTNNRFEKCAYSAKVIDYIRKDGSLKAGNVTPIVNVEKKFENGIDSIHFQITVRNCNKGEKFKLLYSITIPYEYTQEKINMMKNDEKLYPFTYFLSSVAVRTVTIQEEIYNCTPKILENPAMKLYQNEIDLMNKKERQRLDPKEEETLYYKKYSWTIYFSDYDHGIFVYTPF